MISINADTLPVLDALIGDMTCGLAVGGNDDGDLASYLHRLKAFRAQLTAPLPLGPGEDDAKVWIPPADDCMGPHPDGDCPHCGGERFHSRTRRCATCGRRP